MNGHGRGVGVKALLKAAVADVDLDGNACRDEDPDLFFDPRREAEAKAVCARCTVRAGCLQIALGHPRWGVWGGRSFGFGDTTTSSSSSTSRRAA